MNKEIFKDIPNYKGYYQVSNLGNVKSLQRVIKRKNGRLHPIKEILLKQNINTDKYFQVGLTKDKKRKTIKVHQLVAMAFLGYKQNGNTLVINHKNFKRFDNRLENLEIVTMRENGNKKHINSTSKFTGVCWDKSRNKWKSSIHIKGKSKHLGRFNTEIEAHESYKKALLKIN